MPIYPLLGDNFFSFSLSLFSFFFSSRNGRKPRNYFARGPTNTGCRSVSQRIHLRAIIPRLPWLSLPIGDRFDLSSRNNLAPLPLRCGRTLETFLNADLYIFRKTDRFRRENVLFVSLENRCNCLGGEGDLASCSCASP